ncbi:hypothetical protein Q5W88_21630 [Shouchella clausii]|uniref:hypothetical protein n=1 Tax=Shouchella clausii TaxID=79880 RepID=UPI0026F44DFC|nr:hypothetical protein [Shouchella clausii]MDO7285908.1 hypothetical protein [Shouchella clausii]MDO7305811.1 hypothetical protein [Shouchella clausii]
MSKVKKLEERIAKRKERIEKYTKAIKEERKLLKKDENTLAHVKYEDVLKKLMENQVNPDDILGKVDEVIEDENEKEESPEQNTHDNNFNRYNID